MVTCKEEQGNSFVQVKLFNEEGDKEDAVLLEKKEKPLSILTQAGSLPFYSDINKDGHVDIMFNDMNGDL